MSKRISGLSRWLLGQPKRQWPRRTCARVRSRWNFDKLPFVYGIANFAGRGIARVLRTEDSGTTSESALAFVQRGLFVRIHAACVYPACSRPLHVAHECDENVGYRNTLRYRRLFARNGKFAGCVEKIVINLLYSRARVIFETVKCLLCCC